MVSAYTSVAAFVKGMKKAGSAAQFHNVPSSAVARWRRRWRRRVGVAIVQVVPFPGRHAAGDARIPGAGRAAGAKDLSFTELEGYIAARCWWRVSARGRELTRERLVTALESLSRTDGGPRWITRRATTTDRPSST